MFQTQSQTALTSRPKKSEITMAKAEQIGFISGIYQKCNNKFVDLILIKVVEMVC
jgi:hypothetical protein